MTVDDIDVLRVIARSEGIEPCNMWLDDGVVWRTDDAGALRTVCQTDTPYWFEHVAEALTLRLMDRLGGANRSRAAR